MMCGKNLYKWSFFLSLHSVKARLQCSHLWQTNHTRSELAVIKGRWPTILRLGSRTAGLKLRGYMRVGLTLSSNSQQKTLCEHPRCQPRTHMLYRTVLHLVPHWTAMFRRFWVCVSVSASMYIDRSQRWEVEPLGVRKKQKTSFSDGVKLLFKINLSSTEEWRGGKCCLPFEHYSRGWLCIISEGSRSGGLVGASAECRRETDKAAVGADTPLRVGVWIQGMGFALVCEEHVWAPGSLSPAPQLFFEDEVCKERKCLFAYVHMPRYGIW